MTVEKIEAVRYCERIFTAAGEEEHSRRIARHGFFCDRCYYRTERAVRMSGALVEHILANEVGGIHSKAGDDGSQKTKKHPPLPFNVEAFNDANEVYSRLVYWCNVLAPKLRRQAPTVATRAWRDVNGRIVGLPSNTDPATAKYMVQVMGLWLFKMLEQIFELPMTRPDLSQFLDDMSDVYRVAAKWPSEDRAFYAPVRCPDDACRGPIAVYPPQFEGDDRTILCESCRRVFVEDDYDRMASVFRQARTEQAKELIKAHRTAERLTKKHLAALGQSPNILLNQGDTA